MQPDRRRESRNPILNTFLTLKGNQRACLWLEPFFGIPFNLFTPLAAVYMAALGLNPFQIGLVTTVSLASQMVSAPLGGVITDRLGRRLTTAIFDVFAWLIAPILWATAQGPWSFVIAGMLNGLWRVTETSWSLLLVEEAEPDKIIHLYAITNIAGLLAGFVSPLTYFFVRGYGLVTTMRWLYAFMALMMLAKIVLLYRMSHESTQGVERMRLSRGTKLSARLWESRLVLLRMLRDRRIMLTIALLTCYAMIKSVSDNFWPLLVTEKLGLQEENLSIFSTVKTLVMLLLYFIVVPRLDARQFRRPLTIALAVAAGVAMMLFFLQGPVFAAVLFGVALEAMAMATLQPLMSTLNMQAMQGEERARMLGLGVMLTLMFTAPFGTLAGLLSKLDRSLPMLLTAGLAGLSIWLAGRLEAQHAWLDSQV